ncbi:XRE family transcriptional regulator [Rhodobacteraceae bacterium CCMM004]|nr:XRE family transcriptional regulator [Rhodobacteraceae bacterium CCMM004]
MGDNARGNLVPEQLYALRLRSGMSVQQMADKCGIPKSSLESYMRVTNPKRPGLDALLSIADAFDVSIDWLVGRGPDGAAWKLDTKEYAWIAYNTVLRITDELDEFRNTEDRKHELAAAAMLDFLSSAEIAERTAHTSSEHRRSIAADLIKTARERRQTRGR